MSADKDQDNDQEISLDDDVIDGDFSESDDADVSSDEEFDDESWESYDEEPMGDSPAIEPPAKKKSSNGLIIGVTVVIAIGVFLVQLAGHGGKRNGGGANNPQPVAAVPATPPPDMMVADVAPPAVPNESSGGAFGNPGALDNIVKNKTGNEVDVIPPMPTPIQAPAANETGAQEALTPLPQDLPSASTQQAQQLPPPALPPAALAPRPPAEPIIADEAASAHLPRVGDVMLVKQDTSASDQKIAQVSSKLDDLFSRLDQIEKKVDNQTSLPASSGSAPAPDADTLKQLKDIKDSISKLNDRIAGVEAQTRIVAEKAEEAAGAAASAKASSAVSAPSAVAAASTSQAEEAPAPAPVKKKAPVKKAKPAPKKNAEKPAEASASSAWVLKGAMPGKAMLAKSGQSEVFTVGVGDNLAGLGRVTGVYVDNGKWVVETTGGRVMQ